MASANSRKPPLWFVRTALAIIFLPMLVLTLFLRLWRELTSLPKFIWWDLCDEVSAARLIWRTGESPKEKEW